MARVAGKRVLNLFAFTGAFSVAAAAAGARMVTSVDVSEKYLGVARDNFSENRLNPKLHEFIVADVFAELAKMGSQQRVFDVVILTRLPFQPPRKAVSRLMVERLSWLQQHFPCLLLVVCWSVLRTIRKCLWMIISRSYARGHCRLVLI